jgi:hypothetical protein
MSWLLKGIFCFGIMLGLNQAGWGRTEHTGKAGDALKVKILLFDFVSLPEETQQRVQDRVAEIYREAGVEMEWIPCSTGEGQTALYPRCTGYENTSHLFLRIHPNIRKGMKSEAAGEAIIAARIINIYWDRVQSEAHTVRVPVPEVLAHGIAHEIGHLLLGPNSHAPAGIMAARWRSRDLIDIFRGGLRFTPQECDRINAGVGKLQAPRL